jgi:predicted nucleic acid-binding protein
MDELIISDASPLIAFAAIGELEILRQLYGRVEITDIVKGEIFAELPAWIEVSTSYDPTQYNILKLELDAGEASAIALALESPGSKIILDESKGRSVAKRLGVPVIGTLGIIIKAKEEALIHSGRDILDKLEKHGFWISEQLKTQVLERMGEG